MNPVSTTPNANVSFLQIAGLAEQIGIAVLTNYQAFERGEAVSAVVTLPNNLGRINATVQKATAPIPFTLGTGIQGELSTLFSDLMQYEQTHTVKLPTFTEDLGGQLFSVALSYSAQPK